MATHVNGLSSLVLTNLTVPQSPPLSGADIADLFAVFKRDYWYLSPALGAALVHSTFLHNLYCFGKAEHATVQLVREMLHHVQPGEPLKPTRNRSKPGHYLTPARIGYWLGLHARGVVSTSQYAWVEVRSPTIFLPHPAHSQSWYRESRCSRKSLDNFLSLLQRSDNESSLYWPHAGTSIVLAALWLHCKTFAFPLPISLIVVGNEIFCHT